MTKRAGNRCSLPSPACRSTSSPRRRDRAGAVHKLPATPDTCYWGYLDRAQPAVLEVDDGDVIHVEAVTHHAG